MGKLFALLTTAIIMSASYLIFNGQRATLDAREEQSNYEYQGIASNVAKSGFNRGVSAIKRDLMDVAETFERTTMDGGHYDLQITKNHYGNLSVSVDAESGGAEYGMQGQIVFTAPMPAAVALEDEVVAVTGSGDYQISGVDRRMPTDGSGGGFDDPVRGVLTTYSNRGAFTNTLQMSRVLGVGSSPDDPVNENSVVGGFDEPAFEALYQEAILNATDVAVAVNGSKKRTPDDGKNKKKKTLDDDGLVPEDQVISAAASSSPDQPAIIRAIGDLTLNGNVQGHGLLIVEDGDLTINSSSFEWEGLILLRKELKDTVTVTLNNTTIHGGLVGYDYDPGTAMQECAPDFDVVDDEAIVNEPFRVRFKVLGAAITAGGSYDVPVTTRIHMGDQVYEPWGDYNLALDGNINTGNSGVTYAWEPQVIYPAGTHVRVDAKSWLRRSGTDGTHNGDWRVHMEMNSGASSQQLDVLKKDADVPNVGGFQGQYSVEEFLADYIENGKMKLSTNQVTNLFELGMTNTGSPAFDMQDAVVLVTLVKAGSADCAGGAAGSRLEVNVQNNTQIHYSSEAIAKLGQYLGSVRDNTTVRVTQSAITGRAKDEAPVYVETLPGDDGEDEDETETGSDRVDICHKPHKNGGQTKSVKRKRMSKHIAHGDYTGACTGWNPHGDDD